MTTPISQAPAAQFTDPAPAPRLERAAAALTAHGFTVEILDDAAAARARVAELIPEGASVLTVASETLRLSGIDADVNASGRYQAVKPRALAMDRVAHADEYRRLLAAPDVIVGSVNAVTEDGSLVTASASGSQLPGYAGGAARAIWVDRRAEGGARPERRAAPRRRARPPAGEHPRPRGLRRAERRQPAAHTQRGVPAGPRHRAAAARGHRLLTGHSSHRAPCPDFCRNPGPG